MKRIIISVASIGAIMLLGVVVRFFSGETATRTYNDAAVGIITSMNSEYAPLTKLIEQYDAKKPVDIPAFERAVQSLASAVAAKDAELAALTVPPYDTCKAFHQACVTYMAGNKEYVAVYREKVLPLIQANNPATSDVQVQQVMAILEPLATRDDAQMTALQQSQESMAREFGFKLK
jgi:hypothetical protein